MNEKEIKEMISYDRKSSKLFMLNEIFEDLVECKDFKGDRSSSHIAFAYSYTYLCTWLYRYCNYYETIPITQERLKEILGYAATYKGTDYIIKKNGVLEKLGYLETTTDYPLLWEIDDGVLVFQTIKEYVKIYREVPFYKTSKNFKIKLPTKAFHRSNESLEEQVLDGTFYDVWNTHMIPIEVFLYCMSMEEIGVIGFYLYSFIKSKNGFLGEGVDISLESLQQQTGIKATTLTTYLTRLKEHNMIDCVVRPFVFDLPEHLRKANTYMANDYNSFGKRAAPIERRTVLSLHSYEKQYGIVIKKHEDVTFEEFLKLADEDVDGSMLPF